MKKTLAILLSLVLTFCMIPMTAFAADPISIANAQVTCPSSPLTYNFGEQTPNLNVTVNGTKLTQGTDYTVAWQKSGSASAVKDQGDYTAVITGTGNYTGTLTKENILKVIPYSFNGLTIAETTTITTDTNLTKDPADPKKILVTNIGNYIKVSYKTNEISKDDYAIEGVIDEANLAIKVTVTANNNNANYKEGSYQTTTIYQKKALTKETSQGVGGNAKITVSAVTYTGKALKPTVYVYYNKNYGVANTSPSYVQIPSSEYELEYLNNISAGNGTVKVKLKTEGKYYSANNNTLEQTFEIKGQSLPSFGSVTVAQYETPVFTATDSYGNKLREGIDFYVKEGVSTSTVSSSAKYAMIEGMGNYLSTTQKVPVYVVDKDHAIKSAVLSGSSSATFDGTYKTPSLIVTTSGNKVITSGYKVIYEYTDNVTGTVKTASSITDANEYTMKVQGTGSGSSGYAGTVEVMDSSKTDAKVATFTIKPIDAREIEISGISASYQYDGAPLTPKPTVRYKNYTFTEGKDYNLVYANNIITSAQKQVGTITIVPINGGNMYGNNRSVTFNITGKSISGCSASLTKEKVTYSGMTVTPQVTVKDGSNTLKAGVDYTISYKNVLNKEVTSLVDAGTYKVVITGKNAYSGTKELTFTIEGIDISGYKVTLKETMTTWDGNAKSPVVVSVTKGSTTLTKNDYTIIYMDSENNQIATIKNAGEYKIVAMGAKGYSGSTHEIYTVKGTTKQTLTVSETNFKKYVTSAKFKIYATKTGDGKITFKSSDTDVATVDADGYVKAKKIGLATITVTATCGTKYIETSENVAVRVYPKKGTITKKPWVPSNEKGQLKVRFNNTQKGVTKYQIRYSTKKDFSEYKTKTVKASSPYSTQSSIIKGLDSNKTYYVKVRALKEITDNGEVIDRYYGTWSNWRSAKTL